MTVLSNGLFALMMSLSFAPKNGATIIALKEKIPEQMMEQAQVYAQHLGFDTGVHIAISYSRIMPSGIGGYTRYQKTSSDDNTHQLYIVIDPERPRSQQMKILAHEMIHVKQFIDGRLVRCDERHYSWDDQHCVDVTRVSYYKRPWEKEAYTLGNQLYYAHRHRSSNTKKHKLAIK